VHGGDGNDQSFGNNGNDLMSGGNGDDVQYGGDGNDRIFANLGRDTTYGGNGNDDLWALARGDVTAPGDPLGDTLFGEAGNDTIHVRDGEVDNVDCGGGDNDRVIADSFDIVAANCEHVFRRDPAPRQDASENSTQSPADDRKTS
jgi:Ca2+-binding RTX toxin-like protein